MPTQTGTLADVMYVFGQAPWDNAMSGSTFITGGRDVVNVWNDFEPGRVARCDDVRSGRFGRGE